MYKIFVFLFSVALLISCSGNKECPRPSSYVNFQLYLNLASDNPDMNGGYVIRRGQGSGVKGVIVVRYNGTYRAFDLVCPHLLESPCATLEVKNSLILRSPCDGSEFMLVTGEPLSTGDAVSPCGLVEYKVSYNQQLNMLTVTN